MKMRGAAWFHREELSSACPCRDVQLFPLPTVSGSHFQHAQFSLCLVVGLKAPNPCRPKTQCIKHKNAVGKEILWAFLDILPKEHLAATLSNFPVLCKLLTCQPWIVVGTQHEEEQKGLESIPYPSLLPSLWSRPGPVWKVISPKHELQMELGHPWRIIRILCQMIRSLKTLPTKTTGNTGTSKP